MSLKQKTISGVAWNGVGNVARQILQLLSMVVMARFLSPEDFGVYAILMIFVSFMQIFASMGTAQVVVHLDNPSQRMLSSIFFFNIAVGLILFVVMFGAAWPIAYFFDNQNLVHLLQIIGLMFIITTVSLVQKALLEKTLYFKRVVTIETSALAIASTAGIVAAVNGLGIYSLIIHSLTNATLLSIGLWLNSHWRPSFVCRWDDIKQVLGYSFNLTGFSTINYFARHADTFLIGKFIGASPLGVYNIAYKIMLYPLENVSRVIVRVLFPAFSSVKHDNVRFKNGYLKATSFIALVTFPLMAGLFAVAENFVALVFGDKWEGMATLLMILAPIGMMQSIVTTVGSIYTAKGTTGLMFRIGAANAAAAVLSFVVGLPFGVNGVAIAYGISNILMLYPNLKYAWDQVDLGVVEGLKSVSAYFLYAISMAAIVKLQGQWLITLGAENIVILPVQIITGALFYICLLLLFNRNAVLRLIGELRSKKLA
jgi:PST family polysaccharide transporter